MQGPIERTLKTEELRADFLEYTRKAYALLPALDRPRVLDIGCGSGLPTIELAHLVSGELVGIDTDASALSSLQRRLEGLGPNHRVKTANLSLFDTGFADESFDVLWEEGVLHLLDPEKSFPCCHRLLKPSGFLVMHETVIWFEGISNRLGSFGFSVFERLLLPRRYWWTNYYAPLEARIRLHREELGDGLDATELAQYEREIAMVKADPDQFDCGFFILQKSRAVTAG